jgi:type II secretory pathway pseudopilin PulG
MIGVILTKVLPALVIFVFLVSYLIISVVKIYKKAIKLHQEEQAHSKLSNNQQEGFFEMTPG